MGVIARQSAKASVFNYIGIGLGFVNLFLLFPLFFPPVQLGAIRLLLETGLVISTFALLGTNYAINRFFSYFHDERNKNNGFYFWAFLIPSIGFLIVVLGLLIFENKILSVFSGKDASTLSGLYPMLAVLIAFSVYQMVCESCIANHGRIAFPNFMREVVLRLVMLLFGFLYYLGWIDFKTSIWGIIFGYAIVCITNYIYLIKLSNVNFKPNFQFIRQNPQIKSDAFKFIGFLFIGSLSALVIGKIDFFLISAKKGLQDTSIYSIGFYLALLIEIPKRTMLQISTPIIAQNLKDNKITEVSKIMKQLSLNQFLLGCIIFMIIWMNIDNLFQIMPQGDIYQKGKFVVFIIAIGRLFDLISASCGPVLANSRYYFFGLMNYATAVIVSLTANLLLIPIFGIEGAALSTIITFILNYTVALVIIYKKMHIHPFSWNQLKVLGLFVVFMVPSFLGNWFDNPFLDGLVRTPIFVGLFVFVLIKYRFSEDFTSWTVKHIKKYFPKLGKIFD